MSESVSAWICKELSRLLQLSATEDIAKYLMSMENSRDVEDYLQSMLDLSNPEHRQFIETLLNHLGHSYYDKSPSQKNMNVKLSGAGVFTGNKQAAVKKKAKQVNLFSKEGQARESITLPGRHRCECQASKHALVRNCLDCGRVICAQEGTGPCLFCSENSLGTVEPKKSGKQSVKGFLDDAIIPDKALNSAMAHKERLLEFDRTSEHRTRVIDDESDYFNFDSNKWLNPKQRDVLRAKEKELRDRRFGSKRGAMRVTLDFAGRQVVEERDNYDELFAEQNLDGDSKDYFENYAVNPILTFPRPIYDSEVDKVPGDDTSNAEPLIKSDAKSRVQDAELQKMSDPGKCLSMHQPYASLLIAGIKKHEGRTWYSSHRGRLWIASTVKPPTPEEIKELESFYRNHYGKDDLPFPKNYPVGCLLGCVEVADVLPQEEYRQQHPGGESESPYVFICDNPHELFVKFPNKGQHKIYKLDPTVHQTAKKSLKFV